MKLIYSFLFASLLFCSCEKKDYTCNCVDGAHLLSTKEIAISERTQNKAVNSCADQQTKLNVSGSNYNCQLKP